MDNFKVHVSVAALLGALSVAPMVLAGAPAPPLNTFLSGQELAEKLIANVVTIRTEEKNPNKGAGFAIGGDRETTDFVTALHVVDRDHDAQTGGPRKFLSFELTFCADNSEIRVNPSAMIKWDLKADVAIFRIKTPEKIKFVAQSLDMQAVQTSDAMWSLGREGDCKIGGTTGHVDLPADQDHNFMVDMPGASGGTSGSPVISARGIAGMVWSRTANVKLSALEIAQVREIVKSHPDVRWALVESRNIPPTDPDAAVTELTQVLNNYIFRLKDVRDAQIKDTYQVAALYEAINGYSDAANVFMTIKDKHDGTLETNWGSKARGDYEAIRSSVSAIHAKILELNKWAPKNRKVDGVTPVLVKKRMLELSPWVAALDANITSFVAEIRSGGNHAAQTNGQ